MTDVEREIGRRPLNGALDCILRLKKKHTKRELDLEWALLYIREGYFAFVSANLADRLKWLAEVDATLQLVGVEHRPEADDEHAG